MPHTSHTARPLSAPASSVGDRPLSVARSIGGSAKGPIKAATPRGLLALLLSGRILQWRGVTIRCEPGERYPEAVLRVVRALPPEERDALRETVRFLLTTDLRHGPFDSLARRQSRPGASSR